jgi:hypothetical protein
MRYANWSVSCKTPGCNTSIIAKHIGEYDGSVMYALPDWMPGNFLYCCADCGKTHNYTRDNLEVKLTDSPPPLDFRAWW